MSVLLCCAVLCPVLRWQLFEYRCLLCAMDGRWLLLMLARWLKFKTGVFSCSECSPVYGCLLVLGCCLVVGDVRTVGS